MSTRRSATEAAPKTVAVIGAGYAGLLVARELMQRPGLRVVIHEAGERAGGKVLTTRVDGIRVEAGPDSFLDRDSSVTSICDSLDLGGELIPPAVFGARVWLDGRLEPLPSPSLYGLPASPAAALRCTALSRRGRMRAAAEGTLPARRLPHDVAVGEFVRERFGTEVLERLVDPLLAGTRAGDVDDMSLAAALPQVHELARAHGSIMRGLAATAPHDPQPPQFLALRSGMGTLTDRLYRAIRPHVEIRFGDRIEKITDHGGYYDLVSETGKMTTADYVVVCTPAHTAAHLLGEIDARMAEPIGEIEYASSASIALAYPPGSVPVPGDASGVLLPGTAGRTISACTFFTAKWPHVAPPDGRQVVRCFVGRSGRHPALDEGDAELARKAHDDLVTCLGIRPEPLASQVTRWERSLPQYRVGHHARIATMGARLERHPRLAVAGAGYRGSGLPDVTKSALRASERIRRAINQASTHD